MQHCRILIVDDQRDVRRMLRSAVETLGAEISVTDVPSGEEAILVISRQPVDLLISDVRLPGISGLELIERTRIRNPELHLILITGMTDEATRWQLEHALADAYFYKPISVGDFLDAVREIMELGEKRPETPLPPLPAPETPPAVQPVVADVRELPDVDLAAPPVDAGPPAVEADAPPFTELPSYRILDDLRAGLGATLAALVNRNGEAIDLSGEISAEIDEWVAVLRLTSGVVESGGEQARTLIFAPGSRIDFWVAPVAPGTALVVGALHETWRDAAFGDLAAALWRAATELQTVERAPASASTLDGEEPPPDAALQSLDELFKNLETQPLKSMDVDAFWDSAAEDHRIPSEREGGMTYEEAQRLGLAPDED